MPTESRVSKYLTARSIWVWLPPCVFLILAGVVLVTGLNKDLFFLINQTSQITGDMFWAFLTFLSDGLVVFVILFPLIYRKPRLIWTVLVAAVLLTLFGQAVKHISRIPRPPRVLSSESFHLIGPDWGYNSFPSGHASMIFSLAGVFSLTVKRNWLRLLLIGLASVIAAARIVVGVHWPVDVLAGAALGWFSIWIGLEISERTAWAWKGIGQKILGAVFLVLCVALFFADHTGYEDIMGFQRTIAVLSLVIGGHEYARVYGWKGLFVKAPPTSVND
ncbi:MAG: phosphatase PAP2 family protein [Candidatus Aminicenantes bacterium]|nr:phosphatase PAP2 family protein [Candidatus Aminicenantes bacterium]HHF51108.1 phosphatase PAP2 family protein [Candidatus Aminicenantes bacterium]